MLFKMSHRNTIKILNSRGQRRTQFPHMFITPSRLQKTKSKTPFIMSIIPYLSSREISQAQSNIQSGITPLTLLLNIFIWGITYLLTPSVLANPVKTLSSEPTKTRSTKVTTLFESQVVGGSLINPVSSAPIASTLVSPHPLKKAFPCRARHPTCT